MKPHKVKLHGHVAIIGGQHFGQNGVVRELLRCGDEPCYAVKLLTGPERHQKGTFLAKDSEVDPESDDDKFEQAMPDRDRLFEQVLLDCADLDAKARANHERQQAAKVKVIRDAFEVVANESRYGGFLAAFREFADDETMLKLHRLLKGI